MIMPRMRTVPKAVEELRALDPDTALTVKGLDRLIKQGKIPAVYMASRRLVDLNAVCEYLANPDIEAAAPTAAEITPIPIEVRRRATI